MRRTQRPAVSRFTLVKTLAASVPVRRCVSSSGRSGRSLVGGNEIRHEPGPRLMIGDGRSTIEVLRTEFADLPEDVGRLYRAFGGLDGWRFLRRAGDLWPQRPEAILPSPSRLHRVVATRDRWLITSSGQPEPALSFLLTGHLAVKAWERTAPRRTAARLPIQQPQLL